jgi:phenylacetate-CoA ligase
MIDIVKKVSLLKKIYAKLPPWLMLGYATYHSFRKYNRKYEYASPEQIKALQLRHLKEIVAHAWKNIPGYRKHWETNKFHPDKLESLDDIQRIPFITKEMLQNNLEEFSYKKLQGLKKITTGGSTGIPFSFYQQRRNGIIELAFMHELWSRFYSEINYHVDATILRGKKLKGPIGYDPLNGLILSSFDLVPNNIEKYIKAIEQYKTPILRAYPSSLHVFTSLIKEQGLNIKHQFKAIMLGSEKLYDFQKEPINEIFNSPLVNWYGHGEKAVLAGYCEHNEKFHSFSLYGITEIIDSNNLEVSPGDIGEIVGTSFWNYATPFIRYKTKDYAKKGPDFCDQCGRYSQIIEEIQGREHEFIVDKNKKLIALTGVSIICGTFSELMQFRFIQQEIGKFTFKYIKKHGVDSVNTAGIQKALVDKLGDNFEIEFEEVNQISRTPSGKLMYLEQHLDIKKLLHNEQE